VGAALGKARGEWPAPQPPAVDTQRPFEVWVTNGFRAVHKSDGDPPAEQHFAIVRRNPFFERDVVVEFTPNVVAAVSEEAGRPLDRDAAFWRQQAGLALTHYVWSHADAPPSGRLIVRELTRDLLAGARKIRG